MLNVNAIQRFNRSKQRKELNLLYGEVKGRKLLRKVLPCSHLWLSKELVTRNWYWRQHGDHACCTPFSSTIVHLINPHHYEVLMVSVSTSWPQSTPSKHHRRSLKFVPWCWRILCAHPCRRGQRVDPRRRKERMLCKMSVWQWSKK